MSTASKLPISSSSTASAAAAASLPPPPSIATPASSRAFLTFLSDSLRGVSALRRPWSQLVDPAAFCRPATISEAASRLHQNFSYFRANYFILFAASIAVSLLSQPMSLFSFLSLLAAWIFLYIFRPSDQPVAVCNRKFSDREILGFLVVLTAAAILFTNVGSLLMSGTLAGLAIVCAHGALRVPEYQSLDDQGAGVFSIVSRPASTAAVAPGPTVVPHVGRQRFY